VVAHTLAICLLAAKHRSTNQANQPSVLALLSRSTWLEIKAYARARMAELFDSGG